MANLKMCYSEESREWMLLNKVALLDPQFSCLVHLSPEQRNLVSDSLSQEMKESERGNDYTQAQEEENTPALDAMGSLFGDFYKSSDFCYRNAFQEMQTYMKETPLSADSNPLLWLRVAGICCTLYLSKLACKYLCVPGTSVCSEWVFLSAGNIVNKKRATLDPDHIDWLVFLANNIRNKAGPTGCSAYLSVLCFTWFARNNSLLLTVILHFLFRKAFSSELFVINTVAFGDFQFHYECEVQSNCFLNFFLVESVVELTDIENFCFGIFQRTFVIPMR